MKDIVKNDTNSFRLVPLSGGLLMAVFVSALSAMPVQENPASDPARIVTNPPLLQLKRKTAPMLAAPRKATEKSHEAELDLNIVYTDGRIWNPSVQRFDKVSLRSYRGARVDPDAPFVSPTLEINPGDTIRINLNNRLPADPSCIKSTGPVNAPHCFNGTNLHTHGLWVNPAGNGDNVLISVNPGVSFQYEYDVPSDHPAGTFWYHTHRHGSTALQVSSGMAGALIIRGRRPPTQTGNGDIDTLLKPTAAQPFRERVLVMQQIQYACRDAGGKIKLNPDETYRCDPGDIGGIEHYDQFGPNSWPKSGRFTSINGHVLPTFDGAVAGRVERWRVIHGGVRDTINLQFRELKSGARSPSALPAAEHDAFVSENCAGEPLPQHAIAADGLTMGAAIEMHQTVFQPAYRWDLLMVFPRAGTYCVIDAAAPASASVGQNPPSHQLLGLVRVTPGLSLPAGITSHLVTALTAAAAVNMPASVRAKIVADLRNGLKLTSFVPHPDIPDTEVTGRQSLLFNIDVNVKPTQFQVNGKPFDPGRVDRVLTLGGVDEWTLKSDFVSHPFHIHVNPFQIMKILDPSGKDVSTADAVDNAGGTVDLQYRALKGMWKDTLWVKNLVPPGQPPGQYTLVVRTRYQRYIGDYVLHCHILDHEDQGMMQIIRVALPDGAGGTSERHQH
ncbi:MAG TPA: multicopper oxidase family protein [Albitalea sp.]|uniref:multicopper oxidase family protein n=1 Tax=Piscinibacter sp. TaxID=1903157 RepID=UPI002ED295F9